MIITRTPLRISFFGGGSDLNYFLEEGGTSLIVGGSINKYIYSVLKIRQDKLFETPQYLISYSKTEKVASIDEIKHRPVQEALRLYKKNDGLELHHIADVPAKTGLASSSAFTNGLLLGLELSCGNAPTRLEIAKKSILFEQDVLKEHVGCQDQILTALGGFNILNIKSRLDFEVTNLDTLNKEFVSTLNDWIVVCYTGIKRSADDATQKQVSRGSDNFGALREIVDISRAAQEAVFDNDIETFAKFLKLSWETKKSLHASVSNADVDALIEKGSRLGSRGSKLLGAGGGGFVAFFVPPDARDSFIAGIGCAVLKDVRFEKSGVQAIHQ